MQWLNMSSLVPQALFSSSYFSSWCHQGSASWRSSWCSGWIYCHWSPRHSSHLKTFQYTVGEIFVVLLVSFFPIELLHHVEGNLEYNLMHCCKMPATMVCDNLFTWQLNNSPTFSLALLTRSSSNSSTSAASTLCHPHISMACSGHAQFSCDVVLSAKRLLWWAMLNIYIYFNNSSWLVSKPVIESTRGEDDG